MSSPLHPSVLLVALSGGVMLAVLWFAVRNLDHPGAAPLAAVVGGGALWALSYALALTVFDPGLRRTLEAPIWLGRTVMPVGWVAFALAYAGRSDLVGRRTVGVLALPHAAMLALVVLGADQLLWTNYRVVGTAVATVDYRFGPVTLLDTLYCYGLIFVGSILLISVALTNPRQHDDQVTALLVGVAVPTVASLKWLTDIGPRSGLDFTPITLAVTGLAFGYAVFRTELLTVTPGVRRAGRQAAIDDLRQAVVLLDESYRVLDCNDAALDLLGVDAAAALRTRLDELVDVAEADLEPGTRRVALDTPTGRRVFDLTVSAVTDSQGRDVGLNVAFNDVTVRERRKQRLAVLNRVLRHNLRNELNVIAGSVESLRTIEASPRQSLEANLQASIDRLSALSDQAKATQRVVEPREETVREVDLAPFVGRVLDGAADELLPRGLECESSVPPELSVRVDVVVLEHVLRNAIDAITDESTESLRLDASGWATGWVDLELTADGDGISDQDRVAIEGDEESALEHANDLRLWLVSWGATTLGGDVSVTQTDGVTTLHLHVPVGTDPVAAAPADGAPTDD